MEERFLEAIREDPANTMLQLVYADWLDEQGDLRGELIRLHVEVCKDQRNHAHWKHYLSTLATIYGASDPLSLLGLLDEKRQRLFACQCVESVLHFFETIYPGDHRPRQAIETSRAYALGKATERELVAAREAAKSAREAAGNAVFHAADFDEIEATRKAARVAAWEAAFAAVRAAEVKSVSAAVETSARAAEHVASGVTRADAYTAALAKQLTWLVSWLLGFNAEE